MGNETESVEPWLRGTHGELDAVIRQVIHALELAGEDVEIWCAGLTEEELKSMLERNHAQPEFF